MASSGSGAMGDGLKTDAKKFFNSVDAYIDIDDVVSAVVAGFQSNSYFSWKNALASGVSSIGSRMVATDVTYQITVESVAASVIRQMVSNSKTRFMLDFQSSATASVIGKLARQILADYSK